MSIMSNKDIFPKQIWMYWDKGWDNAPSLVKKCGESWAYHHPNWTINFLDANNIKNFFDIYDWVPKDEKWTPSRFQKLKESIHPFFHSSELLKNKSIKVQAQSDIIRINLLNKYGGVWVDATVWCQKPLESWLLPLEEGFFGFCNKEKPSMISSWFLAANQGNKLVQKFSNEVKHYWSINNEALEYYWFHGLFNKLYEEDQSFKKTWDNVEKIDNTIGAIGPHYFAPYKKAKLEIFNETFRSMVNDRLIPLFKLSNQKKMPLDQFESIQYLFDSIKK